MNYRGDVNVRNRLTRYPGQVGKPDVFGSNPQSDLPLRVNLAVVASALWREVVAVMD